MTCFPRASKFGLLAALAVATIGTVKAQTPIWSMALQNNSSNVADGLRFTIANCVYNGNACNTNNNNPNDLLEFISSFRGPNLELLGDGSGGKGANIFNSTSSRSLSFNLNVTLSGASGPKISFVSNAITGSPASANTTSDLTYSTYNADTNLATQASNSFFISPAVTITGTPTVFSVSLAISPSNETRLILHNDVIHFSPAPEPASLAVFASAMAGLSVFRRRARRADHIASCTRA